MNSAIPQELGPLAGDGANAHLDAFAPPAGRPGAVVLGGDYQGLGIVRSLGRRGIPICIVDDEPSIGKFSRYAGRHVKVDNLRDENKIVENLLRAGDRFGLQGWVLYPTRDEMVAACSRFREPLSRIFRVPTPNFQSVQWAWDKRNTYRLAQELAIPTPARCIPQTLQGLSQIEHLSPPFALKPAIKEHFLYATKAKAWLANSHAELKEMFRKASDLMDPGEIIVQEVIPGGGSQQFSYCALFRDGQALGSMVAQRRRQHPLLFGRASTYVETVENTLLEDYSERFLKAMNYYGLVEVEYKLDPRDGLYKLLDVNARTWGYHSIGPRAGVDFSYLLYADQMGWPITPVRAKAGITWMRTATDLPAACLEMLMGGLTLREYLRTVRHCSVEAVFSPSDPWPGVVELLMVPYLAIKRGF